MAKRRKQPVNAVPDSTDGAVVNATVQAKHAAHRQHVAAWKIRRFKRLLSEIARREREPLRLYEPLKALVPFHSCRAQERILIGSNRGGKTTGAIMEFVKIITGQHDDPTYPKTNGRAYIVVKDERQIGQVIYRKLFRAGAIRIIRDEETKKWRSYRPLTDSHRKHESKPAPPLIPLRLLKGGRKGISFRLKKDNIFKQFTLTNGWEVLAMPAGGEPPRGTDIHLALFDENVPQSWYDEVTARLMEHHGKLIWSATPQDEDCEALANLADRADQMAGDENPQVVRFDLKLDANVFMEQESKDEFKRKFANDPEQYRIRIEGEFASLGLLVYPEFHLIRHGIKQEKLPKACIPDTWTRYCALDPGNRVCAVAFVAIPPPDLGDHVYLYDELYIRDADADKLGKQMAEKVKGQHFHAIVIDDHGSRRSEFGGKTLKDQARESFEKYKVWDHFTQPYFVPGSDDVEGRVSEFRSWLRGDDPKFVCVEDTTPNCQKEFRRYHRQKIKGVVQDKPDPRSPWSHLMNACEYLAHYRGLRYRRPIKPKTKAKETTIDAYIARMERRERRLNGHTNHIPLSA